MTPHRMVTWGTSAAAESAWLAVSSLFFLSGILIGTWALHIPLAKEQLDASSNLELHGDRISLARQTKSRQHHKSELAA